MLSLKRLLLLGLGIATMTAIPTLSSYAQSGDINNRLLRLENEIQTLSRSVYRGEAPPRGGVGFAGDASAQASLEVRLQQLESDVRRLTGMIEEQAFETRRLQQDMERLSGDLAVRIGDLEEGAPTTGGSKYTATTFRQASDQQQPSAPTDYTGGNLGSIAPSASGVSGSIAAPVDEAASLYENAFALLKTAQYDQAETQFEKFLASYSDHVLAGNAKYWLGETFYVRGDYERAARVFAEGYQLYPQGSKAPDNLLKLGMSLAGMGNTGDACVALSQIEKDYGASSGPVLRRARQEMTRLQCGA